MQAESEARRAPARPLVVVAVALGIGAWLGARLEPYRDGGSPSDAVLGEAVPGKAALDMAALGASAVVALVGVALGGIVRRRSGTSAAPWASIALCLVAGARAERAMAREPPARLEPAAAHQSSESGSSDLGANAPILGVWRDGPGRAGRVLSADGRALPWLAEAPAAPRDGEAIALLPGSQTLPFAGGPEPGPRAAEGRYRGMCEVSPDLLVRRAPPAPRSAGAWFSQATEPWLERTREAAARRLAEFDRAAGLDGLGLALFLGRRDALEHARVDRYTRTGTRHLLAVSGLHVGLLFALAAAFAAAVGARVAARVTRRPTPVSGTRRGLVHAALGLLLLGAYALLAGAAAPISRAALMLGFAWLAPTRIGGGRRPDAPSLLAAAWIVELLLDPLAPLRPGTSLSYLATAGLLAAPRVRLRGSDHRLVAPGLARVILARVTTVLRAGATASVAATLATLPVVHATFGEVAPIGILLTPLCVPLVGALLALLATALLLGAATPEVLAVAAGGIAHAMEALLACADALPGTPTRLPPRPTWMVAIAAWGALHAWRTRRRAATHAGAARPGRVAAQTACLCGAILLVPWSVHPARLEVVLLDVGHGLACVARGPGMPALVVDAGSRDRPRVLSEAVAPLLAAWDPGSIRLVVTHDDRDHAAGAGWLRERYPVRRSIEGAPSARSGERFSHGPASIGMHAGLVELPMGPDLTLRVIRGLVEPGNEGSLAVELRTPRDRVVLLGDAEGPGLAAMLREGLSEGPCDVLLLPHHGSDTPLLSRLLAHLSPREAWVPLDVPPPIAPELDRRGVRWRYPSPREAPAEAESEWDLLYRGRPGGPFPSLGER